MWRRSVIAWLLLHTVSLPLAADRGAGHDGRSPVGTPTVRASTRNSSPLPAGCSLEEIVQFLTAFLSAFNRGDAAALPQDFPEQGVYPHADQRGFQWYSVTDAAGHFVTYDPAELPAYFATRHKQHEQLQLLELEVNASWHPGVALVFRLSRQADDLPDHEMVGKGAMYCDDRTIFVWSMAQETPNPSRRKRHATPEPN